MNHAKRSRTLKRCDCEHPGPFFSGVPGILAAMTDGRLAAGAVVERCDTCERFSSDADARRRLVELGIADAVEPSQEHSFTVHCFVVVRVKFASVLATDCRNAARQTLDRFDWDTHGRRAEFADEVVTLLVDCDGDADFRRSVEFDGELKEIREKSSERGQPEGNALAR